jgi:hypothetical protein
MIYSRLQAILKLRIKNPELNTYISLVLLSATIVSKY